MSVFGVDFGGQTAVVALARRGGIDVCTNEVSNRATPCIVSFGQGLCDEERYIGEAGLNQANRFPKNSVHAIKRFLGRTYQQVKDSGELKFVAQPGSIVELPNGRCGFRMMYNGEQKVFSDVAITAMLLKNLADTAAKENNGIYIRDFVVSVPPYWTDVQRQAMLDASHVAGLNCLRILNDSAAVALQYGLPRATEFSENDEEATNVVIFDVGHTDTVVTVASYTKGSLIVRATADTSGIGGRNFDEALVDHFVEEFKGKHKFDTRENAKAVNKLRIACEKLRKVLSANNEASFGLECFMNDVDVRGAMNRDQFSELVQPLFEQTLDPLKRALSEAGLEPKDIHHVEIAGGATRMPAIQSALGEFMGQDVMKTLNLSECIARGAAFMAAMLSPAFRVRDFQVADVTPFPISVEWDDGKASDDDKSMVLFKRNDEIPKTRQITFKAPTDLTINASYADAATIPAGTTTALGQFKVSAAEDPEAQVRVKFRVDPNGIFGVTGAQSLVEYTEEVPVEDEPKKEGDSMDTAEGGEAKEGDAAAEEPAEPKTKTVKKVRKADLVVTRVADAASELGLNPNELNLHAEDEGRMAGQDKLVRETSERKNAVESYVYEMRSKIESSLKPFIEEAVAKEFTNALNDTENWLYDEGDGAKKQVYVERLDSLQKYGNPVVRRSEEAQRRPTAVKILESTIAKFAGFVSSSDEKWAHIDAEERAKVQTQVDAATKWLADQQAAQGQLQTYQDPVFTAEQVMSKNKELTAPCQKIMDTPKPPPPAEEEAKTEEGKEHAHGGCCDDKDCADNKEKKGESAPMDLD